MTDLAELSRALGAADAEERRRAAAGLRHTAGPEAVALLVRALGDSDWRVRKEAVLSAVALAPSESVLLALVAVLRPGDNVGARNSAVEALAGFGVHAISALAAALAELDADGKKLVVDVLAKCARSEGLPLLKTLLRDPDVNVRGAAVEAVAAIGEACADDAIAVLDSCLDSTDTFVRLAALSGLNRLSALIPWERLEPLASDPILRPAMLAAAGQSGAAQAVPLLLGAFESAHGKTFGEVLDSMVRLAQSSPVARDALVQGMVGLSPRVREAILSLTADDEAALETRRAALGAAALLGGAEAARAAVLALSDDSLAEQAEATLAELGGVAVEALVAGAEASMPEQRAACISLLGPLVALHPDATAAAKRALGDSAPEVVAAALDALGSAGDRGTLDEAVRLLSEGPRVRQSAHRALVALARRHPPQALAVVARAVADPAVAEAAAIVIETLAPKLPDASQHVGFLRSALDSPAPTTRCAALSALAAISGAEAVEPVAFALGDEEVEVRLAAVRALGKLTDREGAPLGLERLVDLARSGAELELAAQAARVLGELGDSRGVGVLGELCGREPLLAVVALEALSTFEGPERDGYLASALSHADPEVVKSAMRVLVTPGAPRVAERVAPCLEHAEWDVRRLAAELLGGLGGELALGALRSRLAVETHELVRDELTRGIVDAELSSGRRRTAPPPSLRGARG
ncbi:MAG: HEAT repeat domain-containing protein [Polyangiaceae bacterium]|nr:HEAT repeat domain-containing protein [Polyangiaceae bacterium]